MGESKFPKCHRLLRVLGLLRVVCGLNYLISILQLVLCIFFPFHRLIQNAAKLLPPFLKKKHERLEDDVATHQT